jgi:hypothetical protein
MLSSLKQIEIDKLISKETLILFTQSKHCSSHSFLFEREKSTNQRLVKSELICFLQDW